MRYFFLFLIGILLSPLAYAAPTQPGCESRIAVRTQAVEYDDCDFPEELGTLLVRSEWDSLSNILKLMFDQLPGSKEYPKIDSLEYEDNEGHSKPLPCKPVWDGELGVYECQGPVGIQHWKFKRIRLSSNDSWARYEAFVIHGHCGLKSGPLSDKWFGLAPPSSIEPMKRFAHQ